MKIKLILLITVLLAACSDKQEEKQDIKQSEQSKTAVVSDADAFDFTYSDIHGKKVSLSDYKGKWVVVNFWATWCKPCRKEIPDFVKFKAEYGDDVEILGIDYEDTDLEVVQSFIAEYQVNYPILRADIYNPSGFENANTRGLPTTVIFNPEGKEANKRIGPVHFDDLREMTGLK